MMIDFAKLANNTEFDGNSDTADGKPLQVLLSDIAESDDNPRTDFEREPLNTLADDIRVNNVKSPVSIRKNPTGKTPWTLNFGARRYRASLIAGKERIPAFIDEDFSDYDAVAENEQRQALSAMELALFIKKRKEQGDTNKTIAAKLHSDTATVTYHLAMIDMPDCIGSAYRSGRVTAARAIYGLVKLYKTHERAVSDYCRRTEHITDKSVRDLIKRLKPEMQPNLPLEGSGEPVENVATANAGEIADESQSIDVAAFASIPALLVIVENRRAVIILERKPTARGMVWVKYLDDDAIGEVKATACALIELASVDQLETIAKETV